MKTERPTSTADCIERFCLDREAAQQIRVKCDKCQDRRRCVLSDSN